MTRSFGYFKLENFPTFKLGQTIHTGAQAVMDDYPVRGAHSEITYLGTSDYTPFNKYKVIHETLKQFRHRHQGEIQNTVIAINEFHLFCHKDGYIMADTSQKEIKELTYRVQQAYPEDLLRLKLRVVDLIALHESISKLNANASVTGGYFHQLKVDRVKSATIFGHEVGESPLWDEFETKGELGGLILNFVFYGANTSAMITRNGGIVIYSSFEESLVLELVENLNQIIEDHSTEESVSTRRRGRY